MTVVKRWSMSMEYEEVLSIHSTVLNSKIISKILSICA